MGGRCGTVWSVCLCSEACAGRCGARDGAVVGRAASARRIFHDMRASRCRIGAAQRGPRRGRLRWSGVESWWNGFLLKGQSPISSLSGTFVACRVPQAHGSLSGRWDAMSSQRALASAWSAEEPESGGSASACASACRGMGQRTLVPTSDDAADARRRGTCGPMKVLGTGRRLGRYR
jgi:hypothetical protein